MRVGSPFTTTLIGLFAVIVMLGIRFLFGFAGAPLASGAIGAKCSRCDAAAITAYLQSLVTIDVDGDGQLSL